MLEKGGGLAELRSIGSAAERIHPQSDERGSKGEIEMQRRQRADRQRGAEKKAFRSSWVTVCAGLLLGLWITACVVFVVHITGDREKNDQSFSAGDRGRKPQATVRGAPQQALSRSSSHASDQHDAASHLDTSHTPQKKSMSKYTMVEQQYAAAALVQRVVGGDAAMQFEVKVTGKTATLDPDTFEISDVVPSKKTPANTGLRILLKGTNGVSVASALNWYLRYHCKVDTSWMSTFPLKLPAHLPAVGAAITRKSFVRWGYYENVCTHSYTQAWWDWQRWEREIDWMAMSGINLPLALTGQEAVMQRVFLKMGLTKEQIAPYFTGPAFLAWNRMINIKSWGGSLPQAWIDGQQALQQRILDRERSLGMTPVLPAFAGGVPEALQTVHPEAKFTRHGNWGGFSQQHCCVLVEILKRQLPES